MGSLSLVTGRTTLVLHGVGRSGAIRAAARGTPKPQARSVLETIDIFLEGTPPEIMTSASPRRMISVASPTAWLLAAQAVRQLMFGPWALNMLAMWPTGMFGSCSISATGSRISSPVLMNRARSSRFFSSAEVIIRVNEMKSWSPSALPEAGKPRRPPSLPPVCMVFPAYSSFSVFRETSMASFCDDFKRQNCYRHLRRCVWT